MQQTSSYKSLRAQSIDFLHMTLCRKAQKANRTAEPETKKTLSYFGGKARGTAKDTPQEIALGSQSGLAADTRCALAGGRGESNGGRGKEGSNGKLHRLDYCHYGCVAERKDRGVSSDFKISVM